MPAAPIPPQNHSTGLSTPFQLNFKPNSSRQHTQLSSESKKASHLDQVMMLLGVSHGHIQSLSGMLANKLTLTRGRELQFKTSHVLCSMVPMCRLPMEDCYNKPIKATTRCVYRFLKKTTFLCLLPWSGSVCWASSVSRLVPHSIVTQSRWPAFFNSELCSVCCGGEFGLEFNWRGALNPLL